MNWEALFGTIISPVLMLGFGYYYTKYPPKEINYIYGYRTRRSMSNQNIWKVANQLGAKAIVNLGWLLLFITIILWLIIPDWSVLISVGFMLLGLLIGVFWCEKQLDKSFDKNGNPK